MCLIIIQDNKKFPGWNMLERAWQRNPHGAGIMYRDNGKVRIEKGLMDFGTFKRFIQEIPNYTTTDIVYHFRVASHGTVNERNTHPFPLAGKVHYLTALSLTANVGIAHNGIISFRNYDQATQRKLNITDTAAFIIDVYKRLEKKSKVSKTDLRIQLERESALSNSRFAFMDKANVTTVGEWHEYDGCKYSNKLSFPTEPNKIVAHNDKHKQWLKEMGYSDCV